jgi:acetyltransferase-like isoleucine patch superfamily enzyme
MSLRQSLKAVVFAVAVTLVSPLILLARIEQYAWGGEAVFILWAQLLAPLPGAIGSYLRGAYYFGTLKQCSWETHIGFGSIFTHRGASMGVRASMGAYCVIGHADIGAEAMIGSRVSIPSGKRQHLDENGQLSSGTRYDTVTIGDHTWIGEGAIVMADIGARCIVSAGAIVIKEMPPHSIIGGNPAKVLKTTSPPSTDA